MTETYIPADRLTLDGTGSGAGVPFPVVANQSMQGLTAGGGAAVTRGTIVGMRCSLHDNVGPGGDTVTVSIYRSSETRESAANPGELMVQASFVFPDTNQTLSSMVPDMEYPFFEQPYVTARSLARANTEITLTPLLKAIT